MGPHLVGHDVDCPSNPKSVGCESRSIWKWQYIYYIMQRTKMTEELDGRHLFRKRKILEGKGGHSTDLKLS